jgi:hypothetical protein
MLKNIELTEKEKAALELNLKQTSEGLNMQQQILCYFRLQQWFFSRDPL